MINKEGKSSSFLFLNERQYPDPLQVDYSVLLMTGTSPSKENLHRKTLIPPVLLKQNTDRPGKKSQSK